MYDMLGPQMQHMLRGVPAVEDFFLDIADDGFCMSDDLCYPAGPRDEAREMMVGGRWPHGCTALARLGECSERSCACSRETNPDARTCFLDFTIQKLAEVSEGKSEVAYASLGSGMLAFDALFVETALARGIPITSAHFVDHSYAKAEESKGAWSRAALAQFCAWFVDRGVDVYAHSSVQDFVFRSRRNNILPVAVLQIDCAPLAAAFDEDVKPQLEEVLQYGGLFCALTPRGGVEGQDKAGSMDAFGEVWRLVPETGRMALISKMRYSKGTKPQALKLDEPLPPAAAEAH
mmetsp:Transcript_138117/g.240216  ORF Transcript_138117/g.240216 Transcript_138117/m.240216 type:complete len:291 (+) Transcript_138117:81-953(+)